MNGESIIYFAKEWNQDRTSCDHVFEQLSRDNKVVWVNSIGLRNPNLASAHDWRRIFSKLRKCLGGLKQVGPTAWVYQPVVIPLPYSQLAQRINRCLLRSSLRRIARHLNMNRPILWTFLANSGYMVGQLDESLVVYYCTDAVAEFSFINGTEITKMECDLASKSDLCFATAHLLTEHLRQYNPQSHVALHGVDHTHFARTLDATTVVPEDIARLPQPIIGFFGLIHNWIDLSLIAAIARKHPEWSIVLIGKTDVDTSSIACLPNIYLIGRRPYNTLPGYCKAFNVGIIPFAINKLTQHVNPIKLREYLSAGLPVVSTALPEVQAYGDQVYIANSPEQFIEQIERALREDTPALHEQRSRAMQNETWEAKVAHLTNLVEQAKSVKQTKTIA
jgi:glycosyltransferase involved in cell wall biosynthesis